jgi:hypothetical protein
MPWTGGYEDLLAFLRQFASSGGASPDYDFNGVVPFILTTPDSEGAVGGHCVSFSDEPAAFLLKPVGRIKPGGTA